MIWVEDATNPNEGMLSLAISEIYVGGPGGEVGAYGYETSIFFL